MTEEKNYNEKPVIQEESLYDTDTLRMMIDNANNSVIGSMKGILLD